LFLNTVIAYGLLDSFQSSILILAVKIQTMVFKKRKEKNSILWISMNSEDRDKQRPKTHELKEKLNKEWERMAYKGILPL